jgi:hypothetical protein
MSGESICASECLTAGTYRRAFVGVREVMAFSIMQAIEPLATWIAAKSSIIEVVLYV